MNAKVEKPLVISVTVVKGGGGATVTEEGLKMIEEFEKLEVAFTAFVKVQSENLLI